MSFGRYTDIYISEVQGELVRFIRPPVTGRSASFHLLFHFVHAVRAVRAVRTGEAKLCGCMWDVVLSQPGPGRV